MEELSHYVIIKPNLIREYKWRNFDLVEDTDWEEISQNTNYREGDLGIIHPAITRLYKRHAKKWEKTAADPFLQMIITSTRPKVIDKTVGDAWGMSEYDFNRKDILVAIYNINRQNKNGSGYRLIPLNEDEFIKIQRPKTFEELTKYYRINKIDLNYTFDLNSQYELIKMFEIFVGDTIDIEDIPIEVTARRIDPKILQPKRKMGLRANHKDYKIENKLLK